MSKILKYHTIVNKIKEAAISINCSPSIEMINNYENALNNEQDDTPKKILNILLDNCKVGEESQKPLCQDTGTAVFFVTIGDEVIIEGGHIKDAIYDGVKKGYEEGFLRKSIVDNPFTRNNTGNNLPPVIHFDLVKGDNLIIEFAAKGGGSENMSALKMMAPSSGREGVIDFVVDCVKKAGPNPCPPIFVGVGVGSNFEGSALLAKKALLEIGEESDDFHSQMEEEILRKCNALNIGPQGLGGLTTVFNVKVLSQPCHIASMPVSVNINCHINRHIKIKF